jgi:hypothetical protein
MRHTIEFVPRNIEIDERASEQTPREHAGESVQREEQKIERNRDLMTAV